MSSPIPPSQLKASIPSVNGGFCSRFIALLRFPQLFLSIYSYERNEQGDITPEACADIQACLATTATTGGPGGGTGGTLDTPVVTATDGTFTDHVQVTWTAPAGATRYEVWRGLTSDVTQATKLANVNTVTSYSDAMAVPGTIYFYFVRAFNDTPASSSYSVGDSGFAGAIIPTLPAATDLVATKGVWSRGLAAVVALAWTKVANAQTYDIYRNTVDDYTTATRIAQDRTPYVFTDAQPTNYGPFPQLVDNGTELCYHDSVGTSQNDPDAVRNWYYWVVPKRANPSAIGPFSNSNAGALGWGYGQGQSLPVYAYNAGLVSGGASQTVPVGATKCWFTLGGSLAGGAGGDAAHGGGGGGAGAIVTGLFSVAAAGKFRLVSAPEADPGAGASATSGTAGPTTKLQYSPAGTFADTVDICTAAAPGAGLWNPVGGGAGGAGATAAVDASVNPSNIYPGRAGFAAAAGGAANGAGGGDSGYYQWAFRGPACPLLILDQPGDASGGHAGGGANTDVNFPSQAIGGKGARGRCFIVFY